MAKVVKFGGSSLASAEQFKKVGDIIRSDAERRYVVPSAPGRRFKKDSKVTDMLYACYDLAEAGREFREELSAIEARYQEIIAGLELSLSLDEEFGTIERNFREKAGRDYAASRGEYLNGIIMAAYLGFEFVDAAEAVLFDEDGSFNGERTNRALSARGMQVRRGAGLLRRETGRDGEDLLQGRLGHHRLHRGEGGPCGCVRELDRCVRHSGGGSGDHRQSQGNRHRYIQGAEGAGLHGIQRDA